MNYLLNIIYNNNPLNPAILKTWNNFLMEKKFSVRKGFSAGEKFLGKRKVSQQEKKLICEKNFLSGEKRS